MEKCPFCETDLNPAHENQPAYFCGSYQYGSLLRSTGCIKIAALTNQLHLQAEQDAQALKEREEEIAALTARCQALAAHGVLDEKEIEQLKERLEAWRKLKEDLDLEVYEPGPGSIELFLDNEVLWKLRELGEIE